MVWSRVEVGDRRSVAFRASADRRVLTAMPDTDVVLGEIR